MIRSIDDLSDTEVRWVLDRAALHRSGTAGPLGPPPLVGLCFLETSLRTRVGFTAAAARLGGQAVGVVVQRASDISMPESVHDTLRILLGYCDVVVARPGVPLLAPNVPTGMRASLISGGDRGPGAEHPSQTLVDVFGIETDAGSLQNLVLGLVGDPRMRAVSSLLRLCVRWRPREIVLVTTERLLDGFMIPPELARVIRRGTLADAEQVDVLYVAGIPHGATDESDRTALRVTPTALARLRPDAVVTSPLPLIDEIHAACYGDSRVRAFEHSDDGVHVRMALIELALGAAER